MARKVHLRPNAVINNGKTLTACGRPLWANCGTDTSTPVVSFADCNASTDRALVTCARCLQ